MARSALHGAVTAALLALGTATRSRFILDAGWKYEVQGSTPPKCANPNATFPIVLDGQQCTGLNQIPYAASANDCIDACCADSTCGVWQWCSDPKGCAGGGVPNTCWIGALGSCQDGAGWQSRGRKLAPSPSPAPGPATACTQPWCAPGTDDSAWRSVDLPHDGVVEGNFSAAADKSHGYIPGVVGEYRKHFTLPSNLRGAGAFILEFDGAQTLSTVYLNGRLLGTWSSGYAAFRFYVNSSQLNWNGADNVLAVLVDSRNTDSWWYDGGGLYRHVWLTAITTPGPYIAPWGVYAPSNVTGAITWAADGSPTADAIMVPSVEVLNNGSLTSSFTVAVSIYEAATGMLVGTATGSGSAAGNGASTQWVAAQPVQLSSAKLWHLVAAPARPALYTVVAQLSVGGVVVDSVNVTTGIRNATFDAATGFWLNGVNTKILGAANHQDFAGVGVAIPDHLQWYRVSKMKQFGFNGWRTAHNPPTTALLDAADELGMVVWDETHRNGQLQYIEALVKRDRNHPSVVIWSACNEVLCNTANTAADALLAKAAMKNLDWGLQRPMSANYNGFIGTSTPLDIQGFDYATQNYDNWHREAPFIPSISSETSSAVSDRDEYANDANGGHVSAFDTNAPGWGETAEGAWGGIGEPNGQGILTRPFISGGWVWTFWDYRGEPTPYAWPDTNSHFGVVDLCGFEKARTYWYAAWFLQPAVPVVYLFPHNDYLNVSAPLPLWVFSNAPFIELYQNGVSLGRKAMPQYGHLEWDGVAYKPGTISAIAYASNSSAVPLASSNRTTTGAPAALRVSIRDGVGATLTAGCGGSDVSLVMIEVVDADGNTVPTASNGVTVAITGPSGVDIIGTGNGDPANQVPSKSLSRPVYHGLALAVVQASAAAGTGSATVTVTSPGLASGSVSIPVVAAPEGFSAAWCRNEPAL